MIRRIFFHPSESCRDLTSDEIGFILDTIWSFDKHLKIALTIGEAIWSIRLETQKYIDYISNIKGSSSSFPLVTPKITLLSLEEWTDRPEPKIAFPSQLAFRKFLILREYHRAMRIPNPIFKSYTEGAINNTLMQGASVSAWIEEGYTSSLRTRLDPRKHQPIPLAPPPDHLYRGM